MTEQTVIFTSVPEETGTPFIYKVLVVLTMMSLIGGALSGVMTYMNVGYSDTFFNDWLSSFLAAATVMPIGFFLMGVMTKLVEKWLPNTAAKKRNILLGVMMACIMESIISFATALNNIGFASDLFFTGWLDGFLAALPLGLIIVTTISMTVKPKIEAFLKS